MAMVPVIDISRWQGNVNFMLMAARGVKGVIVRLGNGQALDPLGASYVSGARAAGLTVGAYWFCNPKADAKGSTQMRRFAARARAFNALDIPVMMDVENYTAEPGNLPVLTGNALADWLEDGADQLIDEFGRPPIVYSNAAYYNSVRLPAGTLARCPIIVARYPWYYTGSPQPPADAADWENWLFKATPKRPQVPPGFGTWQGWQFSAGFNRMGPTYGTSSTDLDLNLIKADAWENWTSRIAINPIVESQPPTPHPSPHPPTTPPEDEPEMPKYYVADSTTLGSALVTTTIDAAGTPRYTMTGFSDPNTAEAWRSAYGSKQYSDTVYNALAAAASR